jgi:membrane fusion protein, multidrug efflux system
MEVINSEMVVQSKFARCSQGGGSGFQPQSLNELICGFVDKNVDYSHGSWGLASWSRGHVLQLMISSTMTPALKAPRRCLPLRYRGGFFWWTLLFFAVLAMLVSGSTWWWRTARSPGAAQVQAVKPVQLVSVLPVRRQDVRVTVAALGSLQASGTALVRSQVGGVLQKVYFTEGQQVQAGQVLAQIDSSAFAVAVSQARGSLARDQAQLDNARLDLKRYRGLLADNAVSQQQFTAQQALVRQLAGGVQAGGASLASAELQLARTKVRAPITGRLGLKQVEVGNVVQPQDAGGLVSITQTQPMVVVFAIPAVHAPVLAAQLRAHEAVVVQAFSGASAVVLAQGTVAAIDNAIDPATDTIKLKALFANKQEQLFPNQAVRVVVQLALLRGVLTVPQVAVQYGAQGAFVYVVNAKNEVGVRVVKPGAVEAGQVEVQGALAVDEPVVVAGFERLREGVRVDLKI